MKVDFPLRKYNVFVLIITEREFSGSQFYIFATKESEFHGYS